MQDEHKPLTGDAQLTSHLNDPAMRRQPLAEDAGQAGEPVEGEEALTGSAHSDVSPLAAAGATPADEAARRARDAAAADQSVRNQGQAPRPEIAAWNARDTALEKERQEGL